jgi:hypothetical protein
MLEKNAEFERQMSGELDVELTFGRTLSCCSSRNSAFFTLLWN